MYSQMKVPTQQLSSPLEQQEQMGKTFKSQGSIASRLQSIQENKQRIKDRLNRLQDEYIPSTYQLDLRQSDFRKKSNQESKDQDAWNTKIAGDSEFRSQKINRPSLGGSTFTDDNPVLKLLKGDPTKKNDIYELNQLRMQLQQKQNLLIKRKFMYRETEATDPSNLDNIIDMNSADINAALADADFDINEYINPIPKELLLKELPKIQKNTEQRLKVFRGELLSSDTQEKQQNRNFLNRANAKTVSICEKIMDDMVAKAVSYYEALSEKLGLDNPSETEPLNRRDRGVSDVKDLVVHAVYSKIIKKILKGVFKESQEQVAGLENLARKEVGEIFGGLINNKSAKWEKDVGKNYLFELEYKQEEADEDESKMTSEALSETSSVTSIIPNRVPKQTSKTKKSQKSEQSTQKRKKEEEPKGDQQKAAKNPQKPKRDRTSFKSRYKSKVPRDSNSFISSSSSNSSFKGDVNSENQPIDQVQGREFAQQEKEYFDNVTVQFMEIVDRTYDSKMLLIEDGIYLIGKSIMNIRGETIVTIPYKELRGFKKFNSYWVVYSAEELMLVSSWATERLSVHYGDRPGKPAHKISCVEFYPVITLLGSICALLIGFDNGVLMKYNLNRDPLNGKLQPEAFFEPIIPNRVLNEEPPLPKQHRAILPAPNKLSPQRHQFRQFFDFHTHKVIGILFFSIVECISIDETLTCALWNCIEDDTNPVATFTIDERTPFFRAFKRKPQILKIEDDAHVLYQDYFQLKEGLQSQIYNNEEEGFAYYHSEDELKPGMTTPLSKVSYKDQRVTSIVEQYFTEHTCNTKAISTCLWNSNLFVLTVREHAIEPQQRTARVISYWIPRKVKREIYYEMHLKDDEPIPSFLISDSVFEEDTKQQYYPALFMLNPGKVLMFSLLTGHMIRNVGDPLIIDDPLTFSHFTTAPNTAIVLTGDSGIHRMTFEDKNSQATQDKYFKQVKDRLRRFLK